MKPKAHHLFLGAVLLFFWGCAPKSAKLQKSVQPPDKTLFETGSDYLKKSKYIQARIAFTTLMSTYPDSEMAADATLAIGDSYYDEGGTENLLLAEDSYKNFIVFFPTNPKAADAYMKIISLNYKMMRSPDRDSTYSFKTLREINRFLELYPDSDFAPIARQIRLDVQENLASGSFGIGMFYEEKQNYAGASQRYQEIMQDYPAYSRMDEVLFHMGSVFEKSNNPEEASIYYGKILSAYPFSKHIDVAKAQLESLSKPLPPVDRETAAENQARVKPEEGFSVLKPFIDLGKAIGFAPPPDLYEKAVKSVAEGKAKTEEAIAAGPAGEASTGNDIQIESVIRKSASGETQDTTTVGSSSTPVSSSIPAKKKETNRYSKKKNTKKTS
jgi:outer membrane assembly lipoprotein YfiO